MEALMLLLNLLCSFGPGTDDSCGLTSTSSEQEWVWVGLLFRGCLRCAW